ncbi:UpxY family transcription antiterminator [Flexithrix dorotheae]|uniref:UpxY family transcription antiterminator n=1 Tax=Flexithrix dorotheae TaxID=70993 RepID=UPI00036B854E|nr:UpxY family transcription antiterminator [Flexithrix dorotheae]
MDKQWYVIYTKPKNEKKVNQRLVDKNIQTFLPLQKTLRQWSDRKKKVEIPVFSSYLFVRIDIKHKYDVLETNGVVRFVNYLGKPAIVREHEIEAIRFLLNNYTEIKAESLAIGSRLEIKAGTLKGNTGIVVKHKNGSVSLALENLGYQLIASIPVNQIALAAF